MIRQILFPVDFSKPCTDAAASVKNWAIQFNARVTLLYVFETPALLVAENPEYEVNLGPIREAARTKLNDFLSAQLEGVLVQRVLIDSEVASGIVQYAQDNAIDLIMMPTLGYTRFRQMLLGSTTAAVLHDSDVPVWTDAHQPTATDAVLPKTIVCAVDCGPETGSILRYSIELAQKFGATLAVVHARPQIDERFDTGISERAHRFVISSHAEDYSTAIAGIVNPPEMQIIEGKTIAEGVHSFIEQNHADLLVIGRGRSQGFMGRLRTNAHDLIRTSGCPVLSV